MPQELATLADSSVEELSNNPLVRAKQEATLAVQTYLQKDEYAAKQLGKIAADLAEGNEALTVTVDQANLAMGELIAQAWKLTGDLDGTFQAWWNDPRTWKQYVAGDDDETTGTVPAPFDVSYARKLKRLADFKAGRLSGKPSEGGRPKSGVGFTQQALIELTAPKYAKDQTGEEYEHEMREHALFPGREVRVHKDRTEESKARLEVIEDTYKTLKQRAESRAKRAAKTGKMAKAITQKDVVEELRKQFKDAGRNLVVAPRKSSAKPLSWWMEEARTEMERYYYAFEADPDGLAAIREVIEQELSVWTAKQEEQQ